MGFSRNLRFTIGRNFSNLPVFIRIKSGPGPVAEFSSGFSIRHENRKISFRLAHQASGHPIFIRTAQEIIILLVATVPLPVLSLSLSCCLFSLPQEV
jgi:hypothetical protein